MKSKIINLLSRMNIKVRENVTIDGDSIDLVGSVSGMIILTAMFVKDLKNKSGADLCEIEMSYKDKFKSIGGLFFYDNNSICTLNFYRVGAEIKKLNIKSFSDAIAQIEMNLLTQELNVPQEYSNFIRQLFELIENSNYFQPDTSEYFKLSLARECFNELPIRIGAGFILTMIAKTECKNNYYHKQEYSFTFDIGIIGAGFYGTIQYDNGDGTYRAEDTVFRYPNGIEYQTKFSLLESHFKAEVMPNLIPINKGRLAIAIQLSNWEQHVTYPKEELKHLSLEELKKTLNEKQISALTKKSKSFWFKETEFSQIQMENGDIRKGERKQEIIGMFIYKKESGNIF